jgi:hypothetical protein
LGTDATTQGRSGLLASSGVPLPLRWRWCPVRLCVRRGLVAVSASVNFQPPRGDRQHKKKSAGRAARCRPRSLLIATCPPPPPPPPPGDPAIRDPGIRACGATVSAAEPAWARGIGRGRASGAGRTAHSRRTNRRRRVRDVRVRGERRGGSCAPHAGCWGQARHGTRELAPVQALAHMLGLFYAAHYCCCCCCCRCWWSCLPVSAFFFLVMHSCSCVQYICTYTRWAGLLDHLTL